jgi:hypothetical protein
MSPQWLAIALIVIIALLVMVILTLLHIAGLFQSSTRGPVESTEQTIEALGMIGLDEDQAKCLIRELVTTAARERGGWKP